ncbi:ABC transporter ATP-binding protein [[Clostridium] scindens]|uniref:ABC transporter ATP-binding protein n=1 Tax=Clostridium scindens (strain JCM 10418 / VPI 12708) TaxID=29347 RepID=UPI00298C1B96|nr:ABC transporter ATP-binding protein [[Clostridium] scindens]WPB32535.1 Iron import ATP-binding/permease protein IrtA [[Clostridium] scindens]
MPNKEPGAIRQLFAFVGESNSKMRISIFLAVLGEMFGIVPFLMVALLADELYRGTATIQRVLFFCGIAAICQLIKMLLTWRSSLMSHKISFTILKNIREAITDRMAKVPMGVMLETPTGTFKNLIVDNVAKLEDSMAHFMPELPSNIAAPLCSILLIFILDWRMGLASLITIPLGILFFAAMMRGYGPRMENYMRSANDMNSSLVEYVNGIQVIKAFNRSASSYGKYSKSVNYFHDSTMEWWSQCWFWNAAARAVLPSTLLGTLPVGAWLYMEGTLSLPVFLISLVVPLGFVAPLMKVSEAMEQVSMIKGNLEQVTAFLKTPELVRPSEPVSLGERTYQFEDVHFGYKETEVLHGISFQTKPGTMTAIVGPSGSGKSTIAKLMAGFWDVTSGSVRFGGQDIRQIPFEQLMGEISYVAQDNFLFDKSIRENIRMGNPAATDEEVEAAAKAANCHDFIMQLEQGYDTLAGDAGDRLSGGERQRITIARAMLKPASVVILDEATAYADPENEALIQQAISKLVAGKTLIVVAHRLNTIRNADQILVVSNGNIAGRGTQEELLRECSIYQKMWQDYAGTIEEADMKGGVENHA